MHRSRQDIGGRETRRTPAAALYSSADYFAPLFRITPRREPGPFTLFGADERVASEAGIPVVQLRSRHPPVILLCKEGINYLLRPHRIRLRGTVRFHPGSENYRRHTPGISSLPPCGSGSRQAPGCSRARFFTKTRSLIIRWGKDSRIP